jgi:hypothetical protein
MSPTREFPYPPGPGVPSTTLNGSRPSPGAGLLSSLAILVGSVVLGLAAGYLWAQLAPQASYVVISHGSADVINPETTAFIAADAVYAMIGAVGGLIIGLAGYLLGVRRSGPWPMAAVLAGSIGAGIIARYVGEHRGLTAFNHLLLTSPVGTHLHAPLILAGDNAATTWPTSASLPALSFWPLLACLAAGGLTLIVALRDRSARTQHAARYLSQSPPPYGGYPEQTSFRSVTGQYGEAAGPDGQPAGSFGEVAGPGPNGRAASPNGQNGQAPGSEGSVPRSDGPTSGPGGPTSGA